MLNTSCVIFKERAISCIFAIFLHMWVEKASLNFLLSWALKLEEACATVLKHHRLRCGLSQHDLAYEANINRNNISLYETGSRLPSLASVFALSSALSISPDQFIRDIAQLQPDL